MEKRQHYFLHIVSEGIHLIYVGIPLGDLFDSKNISHLAATVSSQFIYIFSLVANRFNIIITSQKPEADSRRLRPHKHTS